MINLSISNTVTLSIEDIEFSAIRAQGAGGQNVNKTSSAIHLRFNISQSSLPDAIKQRLLSLSDKRINKQGEIIIKAQIHRTQELNKQDAIERLILLIKSANTIQKTRKATKPTKSSMRKRLDKKTQRSQTKSLRKKISF